MRLRAHKTRPCDARLGSPRFASAGRRGGGGGSALARCPSPAHRKKKDGILLAPPFYAGVAVTSADPCGGSARAVKPPSKTPKSSRA